MAASHRSQLSRLNIPGSVHMQQPTTHQPMFSPAPSLPTSMQHNFHPPFQLHTQSALQTPIQQFFTPQAPGAPGRPAHLSHHKASASMAQLAAAGIHPPTVGPMSGVPMTPLGHNFPAQMMFGSGQGHGTQFVPRNRRTPSMSFGGPPKAVLGGPTRKVSPMQARVPSPVANLKGKKVTVNFPKETFPAEPGQSLIRTPWAREPLDLSFSLPEGCIRPPDVMTAIAYAPDDWRLTMPHVFLPGKSAWDAMKQRVIEEKLEKLGVERGTGCNIPQIHAPHARATSISSPADSALLHFKLNKLQQSQVASATESLASSPQTSHLSTSPNPPLLRFQNRHGHSLSLAQPPSLPPSGFYNPTAAFNPFGPNAILGSDQIIRGSPNAAAARLENIHAPQGRVPVTISSLAAPNSASRPDSRPDFTRGFGLDIPEEDEPEEDSGQVQASDRDAMDAEGRDGVTTVAQSRLHSRHVSSLSSVLSLRSVGGSNSNDRTDLRRSNPDLEDLGQDGADEWTGSEDLHDISDESIGDWSNPSDEERARQQRVRRRIQRRAQPQDEEPRRLPNFPRPPDNTFVLPREHDVVSNPSEINMSLETNLWACNESGSTPSSNSHSRPLPPVPHSRVASGQLSGGHSHGSSGDFVLPGASHHFSGPGSTVVQRDSLNPHAKPFVFGTRAQRPFSTSTFEGRNSFTGVSLSQSLGHSRVPSLGKPLNAAAQEFKPGAFTFRPPPGVPQLAFPSPELTRPLPVPPPPLGRAPARAQQGREKRQRRGSSASRGNGSEDGMHNMSSFRFPPGKDSPRSPRCSRSASCSPNVPRGQNSLNAAAPPFTFSGLSGSLPFVPKEPALSHSLVANAGSSDDNRPDEAETSNLHMARSPIELPVPPTFKPKKTPVPLDFTHHASNNKVPAGLFKALVNGADERTRRTVRSRMSSRDVLEHIQRPSLEHIHRHSLEDFQVPSIARKVSRSRLVNESGSRSALDAPQVADDLFSPAALRQTSLPPVLPNSSPSNTSDTSLPENSHISKENVQRLEALLDEKIETIRRDLVQYQQQTSTHSTSNSTEGMITEVISLFRAQLQESAARGLEESQVDARGELDFELIKDTVQQGHAENRALLQRELGILMERLSSQNYSNGGVSQDVMSFVEELSNRTIHMVANAMSQLSGRLESFENNRTLSDHNSLLRALMEALTPALASLRSEPVDYGLLTDQLTQAVKPHISQLIDLASDKRETAGLIVDRLLPLLPSILSPSANIDIDVIVSQLTTEVRRAIAPIDAFEIKEQVADLVVERLDSRLAVRDRTFNVDTVTGKVTEGVGRLLEPIKQIAETVTYLVEGQHTITAQQGDISTSQRELVAVLSDIPAQLAAVTEAVHAVQNELVSRLQAHMPVSQPDESILHIKASIDEVTNGHKTLSHQRAEFLTLHNDVIERLRALPESLSVSTSVLQAAHADFVLSRDATKRDIDETRKLNSDLQVQLAKARGAHGQVRVEKDALSDKLKLAEGDRERLHSEVQELQHTVTAKSSEVVAIEKRSKELEEALSQALARLQASDVAAQTSQERIAELEKANRELVIEKQNLTSKTDKLELEATFATRDQDAASQALAALQKQHDHLTSQQSHWDDLRHASQQIEILTTLFNHADDEEVKDLRRIRDRSQLLEGEHAALQKRFKDQESKASNSEKAMLSARQALAQAQQRSSEWERRAKEYEGRLDQTQTLLDQSEQTQTQLDADYSLAKLQLEEKEADERLNKDRENKLRDQVSVLEGRVRNLQTEVERFKASPTPSTPTPYRKPVNGSVSHRSSRPDSRASSMYGERLGTPVGRSRNSSIRSTTPEQPSVWDSMHAPTSGHYTNIGPTPATPKARHSTNSYYHSQIPSPTPSTVSLTPTQGDDGWWS